MKHLHLPLFLCSILLLVGLCGCGQEKTTADPVSAEPAVLAPEQYTITEYDTGATDQYCWLLCASDFIYYTSGVQEQMEDASRSISVYAFNPESGKVKSVPLPYTDGWHLYAMTPAADGGFWMVFTPLTANSMYYAPNPAYLVKTNGAYEEELTIDLTRYSNKLVEILGAVYPENTQFANEMLEEEYPLQAAPYEHFFKASIICDDAGRVYVTSADESVIVFDQDGNYLGKFDTFDPEYSQGVSLIREKAGTIAIVRSGGDFESKIISLNADTFTTTDVLTISYSDAVAEVRNTPITSLMEDYEFFTCGYYGLYGIRTGEQGSLVADPLLYYDACGMPEDGTGVLWENGDTTRLIFDLYTTPEDEGQKHYSFFVLTIP